MQTILERREGIAESLSKLRAYRKDNRLCRECGDPLEDRDITKCFRCRVKHATREVVRYYKRKEEAHV